MRDGCRSQRRLPLRTVTNGPCLCPEMRNEHTSGTAARRRRPQQPKSNAAESACTSGGARAGVGTGISEGSPRWRRIFWMAGVWSIKAIRRRRPSQRGQARTSKPKVRRIRSAQSRPRSHRPSASGVCAPTPACAYADRGGGHHAAAGDSRISVNTRSIAESGAKARRLTFVPRTQRVAPIDQEERQQSY